MPETLQNLFVSVVVTVIPVLTTFIVVYLKKKTTELMQNIDDKFLKNTIDEAIRIITDAVVSTTQTYVESLKKAGKFNVEEQALAFEKSKNAALTMISTDTKELIQSLYGDFDLWLENKIESTTNKEKNKLY